MKEKDVTACETTIMILIQDLRVHKPFRLHILREVERLVVANREATVVLAALHQKRAEKINTLFPSHAEIVAAPVHGAPEKNHPEIDQI